MSDDIWYREELLALLSLVEAEIRRANPFDLTTMVALGGLHKRIELAVAKAPSMRTPEASA